MVQPVFVVNSGVRGRREPRGCCLGGLGRMALVVIAVLFVIGWIAS